MFLNLIFLGVFLLKRIENEPMLLLDDKYLVIADLHLGVEEELYRKGITVLNQVKRVYESIKKVHEKYKFSTLFEVFRMSYI